MSTNDVYNSITKIPTFITKSGFNIVNNYYPDKYSADQESSSSGSVESYYLDGYDGWKRYYDQDINQKDLNLDLRFHQELEAFEEEENEKSHVSFEKGKNSYASSPHLSSNPTMNSNDLNCPCSCSHSSSSSSISSGRSSSSEDRTSDPDTQKTLYIISKIKKLILKARNRSSQFPTNSDDNNNNNNNNTDNTDNSKIALSPSQSKELVEKGSNNLQINTQNNENQFPYDCDEEYIDEKLIYPCYARKKDNIYDTKNLSSSKYSFLYQKDQFLKTFICTPAVNSERISSSPGFSFFDPRASLFIKGGCQDDDDNDESEQNEDVDSENEDKLVVTSEEIDYLKDHPPPHYLQNQKKKSSHYYRRHHHHHHHHNHHHIHNHHHSNKGHSHAHHFSCPQPPIPEGDVEEFDSLASTIKFTSSPLCQEPSQDAKSSLLSIQKAFESQQNQNQQSPVVNPVQNNNDKSATTDIPLININDKNMDDTDYKKIYNLPTSSTASYSATEAAIASTSSNNTNINAKLTTTPSLTTTLLTTTTTIDSNSNANSPNIINSPPSTTAPINDYQQYQNENKNQFHSNPLLQRHYQSENYSSSPNFSNHIHHHRKNHQHHHSVSASSPLNQSPISPSDTVKHIERCSCDHCLHKSLMKKMKGLNPENNKIPSLTKQNNNKTHQTPRSKYNIFDSLYYETQLKSQSNATDNHSHVSDFEQTMSDTKINKNRPQSLLVNNKEVSDGITTTVLLNSPDKDNFSFSFPDFQFYHLFRGSKNAKNKNSNNQQNNSQKSLPSLTTSTITIESGENQYHPQKRPAFSSLEKIIEQSNKNLFEEKVDPDNNSNGNNDISNSNEDSNNISKYYQQIMNNLNLDNPNPNTYVNLGIGKPNYDRDQDDDPGYHSNISLKNLNINN